MIDFFRKFYIQIILVIAKTVIFILRLLGKGATTLPGKIAITLNPNIIQYFSEKLQIIAITGTNGKTTTTRIVEQILIENDIKYINNKSGANLSSGIATTLISNVKMNCEFVVKTALLEIDEAAFKAIAGQIKPQYLIVTNFFRDQLDRYGELYTTLMGVKAGIEKTPETTLIINADDSLCASLGRDTNNEVIYFGFDEKAYNKDIKTMTSDGAFCIYCEEKYRYDTRVYGHLGHFSCDKCGYSRPDTQITLNFINELTNNNSNISVDIDFNATKKKSNEIDTTSVNCENDSIENSTLDLIVNLPGLYNIYNALAGITLGSAMQYTTASITKAVESFECGFGRMESIDVDNKKIQVILVKNPTGFNQVLDFLKFNTHNFALSFIINDLAADGKDISWLWDVDFEQLTEVQDNVYSFLTSGLRSQDMAVRLKYAGIYKDKIISEENMDILIESGLDSIKDGETLYILPTYTALLSIRKILEKKYNLNKFWR